MYCLGWALPLEHKGAHVKDECALFTCGNAYLEDAGNVLWFSGVYYHL